MTLQEVRRDLAEIQTYYRYKKTLDKLKANIKCKTLLELVDRYNRAISGATAQLYVTYILLYIQGHTQQAVAEETGYSLCYVKELARNVQEYLLTALNRKEEQP